MTEHKTKWRKKQRSQKLELSYKMHKGEEIFKIYKGEMESEMKISKKIKIRKNKSLRMKIKSK